jgi:UDP-N-acetylmuramyl pentapeptide phosphotransferase/UDP-N-acetylglucosamine-1-phosphate transferase
MGGWVPGKLYGLNLYHSILCVGICFGIIGFFDKKLKIGNKTRQIVLIVVSILFIYEVLYNFFFHNGPEADISQFRQYSLLQLSFFIGILIKIFNPEDEMN